MATNKCFDAGEYLNEHIKKHCVVHEVFTEIEIYNDVVTLTDIFERIAKGEPINGFARNYPPDEDDGAVDERDSNGFDQLEAADTHEYFDDELMYLQALGEKQIEPKPVVPKNEEPVPDQDSGDDPDSGDK